MLTIDKIRKVNIPSNLWRANNAATASVAPYNDSVNLYDAVVVINEDLAGTGDTDLGASQGVSTTTITSSTGDDATILGATDSRSGVMTSTQAIRLDALLALSGVSDGDEDLGTFTGTTISNNTTIKDALQELETALELVSTEAAQDAVGTILVDTATIDFTYNDSTPSITADVINNSITFAKMQQIATTTLLGRTSASTGNIETITIGTGLNLASGVLSNTGGTGTVTSVGVSVPATLLLVSSTPVTTAGTIALSLANQSANTVFAGATSGTSTPTFRSLVANDIPSLTSSKISDFNESVDDRVNALLVEGTGVTLTYDDTANTLTIDVAGTTYTDEEAQDAVGNILLDSTTIDFTYNDTTPTITAGIKSNSISNSLLTSGVGGFYKGSGTIASGVASTVTSTSTFRINYSSTNTAFIVDDADSSVSLFADTSYVYVNDATVEVSAPEGLVVPSLTETERDAIGSPAAGAVILNTTTSKLNFYSGAGWEEITST